MTHVLVSPSVTVIDKGVFRKCRLLSDVELSDGLQRISAHAFKNCSSLVRIMTPSTVVEIGVQAFMDCSLLVEVELCVGLKQILQRAFK